MFRKRSLLGNLLQRERGDGSKGWLNDLEKKKASSLSIVSSKSFKSAGGHGVTWLDIDHVDHRYMLASSSKGAVSLFDVQTPDGEGKYSALKTVDRTTTGGHQYLVSAVAWYPVDTGMFVSGSFDAQINIWDTNKMEVAYQFDMGARVYSVAMSAIATSHCLVAVGSEDPLVKLCDPSSGGFSHTLEGHSESVWAVHWSLGNEFELVTGGMDGQLRLWDIRRSGCMRTFDQHYTRVDKSQENDQHRDSRIPREPNKPTTGHDGHVTAVKPTPNGLCWISAATDSRVRLWDAVNHTNMLVNYSGTYNRSMKARQLAVSSDSELIFHPSGSVVQVFDLSTGETFDNLRGHMDTINCCLFNPSMHELYSGSNDGNILVWGIPHSACDDVMDQDNWSDD
ncbi:hypothetical protein BSKO_06397 [Bryopsis sp. KO-2023]|nr:hypothetical protein BSKO_06397 [Bryopsis sp. KO-2023]